MRTVKLFSRILAVATMGCMMLCNQPWTYAAAEVKQDQDLAKLYLSDVKMFYSTTEAKAKKDCEAEGYIFCSSNLKEGANTDVKAYIGYKTTKDKDNAITDLTLLDSKNSHFESMSYEQYLDKHLGDYSDVAADVMVLVNEFRANYKAGSPNAKMAYDMLNFLFADATKPVTAPDNKLGDYMLNKADKSFFEKFMQRGNAQILSFIIGALATATTDYNEEKTTWISRSKHSCILEEFEAADSATRNFYNSSYQDPAKKLIEKIQSFATTYRTAKSLYDEYGESFGYNVSKDDSYEDLLEQENCLIPEYVGAIETYELLDQIEYCSEGESVVSDAALLDENGEETEHVTVYSKRITLAEYFLELAEDPSLSLHPESIYPIIEAMTPGQRIVISQCGLNQIAKNIMMAENYEAHRQANIDSCKKQLADLGYQNGMIWLWTGVDFSELSKKAVETGDLIDAKQAGKNIINATNEAARKESSSLTIALRIADIVILSVSGVAMIAQAIVGCSLWTAGLGLLDVGLWAYGLGSCVLGGFMAVAGVFLCVLWVLNVVAIVLSLVYLVYMILDWCGAFDTKPLTDYSTIPDYIFHMRGTEKANYRVRYEKVKGNATHGNMVRVKALRYFKYDSDMLAKINAANDDEVLKLSFTVQEEVGERPVTVRYTLEEFFEGTKYGDAADLGAYQSTNDRWQILCASRADVCGTPIEVPADKPLFVTSKDYHAPEGYRGITLISGSTSQDINIMQISDKAGPAMYLFVAGESDVMNAEGAVTESDQYVSRVVIVHEDTQEMAVDKLLNSSFEVINTNLTPGNGWTLLGYQLGSRSQALTDLRVAGTGMPSITYGDATYGRQSFDQTAGVNTTPYGLSLYATSKEAAGTPILKVSVETERLPLGEGAEPACLFTGGQAVDFSHNWNDNSGFDQMEWLDWLSDVHWAWTSTHKDFDLGGQDDPVKGTYIYFWPETQYTSKDEKGNAMPQYVSGFSYFMASDKDKSGTYGTGTQFIQQYAKENGFELVQKNGAPAKMISASAGEMRPCYNWKDAEGGAVVSKWNYNIYHLYYRGLVYNESDGAMGAVGTVSSAYGISEQDKYIWHTDMYFGVSYTYNPYRAITGVAGLITPYTETTTALGNMGLATPAGTYISCTTNIQGYPLSVPGVNFGYSQLSRNNTMYVNQSAKQKSDLTWMTDQETEVRTHYLLQGGSTVGRVPLLKDDLMFVTDANPGTYDSYVPVCDLRTPGDYAHPLNFALDTTNLGSEYLYIYLKKDAGGRAVAVNAEEQTGEGTQQNKFVKAEKGPYNAYNKKEFIAGVFCGVGKTPEAAIASLYGNAIKNWANIAQAHPDISSTPLITEFDEIIPVDLSDKNPWYTLHLNDTDVSLKDDEWVYGNESANRRWGHERMGINAVGGFNHEDAADEHEKSNECAYIGVVRSAYAGEVNKKNYDCVYAVMKYYKEGNEAAPATLNVGGTNCILAGGPVKSPEGQYYVYYSTNSGTASFCAPVTEIDISDVQFINGYNTSYSCKESDRVDFKLPSYSELRMRTDEQYYIHTKYNMADLPYIEALYIGIGNNMKEAYADLVGTTAANGATDVNCCYNSYSDKWVAIGYRRTNKEASAIRDVVLYVGEDPVNDFTAQNAYMLKSGKLVAYSASELLRDEAGNLVKDEKGKTTNVTVNGPKYKLLKHAVKKDGKTVYEPQCLNPGTGATPIYLYYTITKSAFYYDKSDKNSLVQPIRNIAFTYGDTSPKYASAAQLASVYNKTVYGQKNFDAASYANMHWENVGAILSGAAAGYQISGANSTPISLSYRTFPKIGNNVQHTNGDKWVRMYVDRGSAKGDGCTHRAGLELSDEGYYAETSRFGVIEQKVS